MILAVLDPEVEHPESRKFKRDFAAYISEHRGEPLAATLTVTLGYLTAGEPAVTAPRSRFAEWDRFVRRPLLWLGCADPLTTQAELQAADPVRESLVAVLHTWSAAFGDDPTTIAKAVSAATELNQQARLDLYQALHAVAGEKNGTINSRRLGRYMKRNARRIEEGLRIEIAEEDLITHRQRYRVARV